MFCNSKIFCIFVVQSDESSLTEIKKPLTVRGSAVRKSRYEFFLLKSCPAMVKFKIILRFGKLIITISNY